MSWDNGADWAMFTYYDDARLKTAQNANSTVYREYDDAGRMTLDRQTVTSFNQTVNVNHALDDDGKENRLWITPALNPSYDYSYTYDTTGRFEKIIGSSLAFQYYYDPASNETYRRNWLSNPDLDQFYNPDSLNRISLLQVKKGATLLASEAYGYDPMNRVTSTLRQDGTQDGFGYYKDGELSWTTYNGTRTVAYSYDGAGNRTAIADTVNGGTLYTLNPNNFNEYSQVGNDPVTNGPEHEIKTYKGSTYTYLNDEHLISVNAGFGMGCQLAYDALGRCVTRIVNAGPSVISYYIYDGEKPILEYKSTDLTLPVKNLYGKGIDEILMRTDPSVNGGAAFYYQQDHEGSVTHLTNASGNVIEKYKYDVYGAPTFYNGSGAQIPVSAYNNRFLFTGREYNSFGFYEYRARAYHPGLGRFMSEDPKLFDAGDYNLFRYCHNDPVDMTDPMGTEPPVGLTSPRQMSHWLAEVREAVQQVLRQAAQQRAYATAYSRGNYEGGTSFIGTANFHMGQITKSNASSPQLKQYSTRQAAGRAALGGDYDGVQLDQAAHEYGNWLLQQNGAQSGHYAFVPGIPGSVQYVPELRQKMQTTTLLGKNIPAGYHAIGWHYAQVRHADYVPVFDRQVADQHRWFVALRVPGAGGNWARPNTFFYPPGD